MTSPEATDHDEAAPEKPTIWSLDPHGIKSAIREALPEIERCYRQAAAKEPAIPGRITVGFTIATDDTGAQSGRVMGAEVREDSAQQRALGDCLLQATASLRFERPTGGSKDVILPFDFAPERAP